MSVDKIYKLPNENADSGAGILWSSVSAILGAILLACWIATQHTAYKLGYQPALGAPLFGKKRMRARAIEEQESVKGQTQLRWRFADLEREKAKTLSKSAAKKLF